MMMMRRRINNWWNMMEICSNLFTSPALELQSPTWEGLFGSLGLNNVHCRLLAVRWIQNYMNDISNPAHIKCVPLHIEIPKSSTSYFHHPPLTTCPTQQLSTSLCKLKVNKDEMGVPKIWDSWDGPRVWASLQFPMVQNIGDVQNQVE